MNESTHNNEYECLLHMMCKRCLVFVGRPPWIVRHAFPRFPPYTLRPHIRPIQRPTYTPTYNRPIERPHKRPHKRRHIRWGVSTLSCSRPIQRIYERPIACLYKPYRFDLLHNSGCNSTLLFGCNNTPFERYVK